MTRCRQPPAAAESRLPKPLADHERRACRIRRVGLHQYRPSTGSAPSIANTCGETIEVRDADRFALPRIVDDSAAVNAASDSNACAPRAGSRKSKKFGGETRVARDATRVGRPHTNQPIRLRIRKRPQDDGIDDAEDGRVGADAERERGDRRGGEPGALAERSQSKSCVL